MSEKKQTFQHLGHYVCECGREFEKSQSYNAHLSHCKVHLGDEKYQARLLQQKAGFIKGNEAQAKLKAAIKEEKYQQAKIKWESTTHYCEMCGKELPHIYEDIYSTGRFCSKSCAAKFSTHDPETRKLISNKVSKSLAGRITNSDYPDDTHEKAVERYLQNPSYCAICGKQLDYENRNRLTCGKECLSRLRKINGISAADNRKSPYNGKSGYYNGIFFASSWELAYWLYCKLNNIKIIRNTDYFEYTDDVGTRYYLPDFKINDATYIEIKGKGIWFKQDNVNCKLQGVINSGNKIEIYYEEDLQDIFKEVCLAYNVKSTKELVELLYE